MQNDQATIPLAKRASLGQEKMAMQRRREAELCLANLWLMHNTEQPSLHWRLGYLVRDQEGMETTTLAG